MNDKLDFRPLLELMGFMILGMLSSALLNEALFHIVPDILPSKNPQHFLLAVSLSLIGSFGLPAFVWLKWRNKLTLEITTKKTSVKTYTIALFLFVALIFVGDYFMNWFTKFLELRGWTAYAEEAYNLRSVRDLIKKHPDLFPQILFVIAVIPAFVEEFFFRRIIFSYLLQSSKSFWTPAILSSLFFAGMHNHLPSFFPIFLLGLALSFAFYTTQKIGIAILLHGMNNALSIFLLKYNLADEFTTHWILALIAALFSGYVFMKHLNPAVEKTA